ncbi:MAG TPA: thiamine-phosphate kinase [Phycisphaerales bacterium]|nr:thiamine-phosphate kinase [Phycisphaerales bacterium]
MIESALLAHIYARSKGLERFPQVLVGPGDDCAVLAVSGGGSILLTVDHLVEGRHVPPLSPTPTRTELDAAARKAIARSVSDIAAMGGTPIASLATACMPPGFPQAAADQLFDRMHFWAQHFNAPLIGGDIAQSPALADGTRGHFILTSTLIGSPHTARGPVLRSTARPGDLVCITGRLGNSLHSGRHASFSPRVAEAAWLCAHASPSAMIDLSDGLGRDAARVAHASNVTITIDAARLPVHDDLPDSPDRWRRAAGDGEDYELLVTLPDDSVLARWAVERNIPLTVVGRVEQGPATCRIIAPDGAVHDAGTLGWDHAS